MEYSTKRVSSQLIEEITSALKSVNFGSIEIYVTDNNVTQITTRTIKKTAISTGNSSRVRPKKTNGNGKSKKYAINNVVNFNKNES